MKPSQTIQNIQSSYIREILSAANASNVISLAGGLPDSGLLSVDLLVDQLQQLGKTPEVFQYGETQGYAPLLEFLADAYNLTNNTSSMITNGSQQGIDLIARAFIDAGDVVVMEAPSYLGAIQVFDLAQAKIETVEQLVTGPDLNQLESVFKKSQPKLFYAVPDFHNPTGVSWSLQRRKQVAKLCEKYQVTFIEDAPYRELRFAGKALPMVSSFCPERSIVLRSFSKITAPGIRLGVVCAPREWLQIMLKVKQAADLHTAQPLQAALLGLLKHDAFEDHITTVRQVYAQRYAALQNALQPLVSAGCTYNNVAGGMFIWLVLNELKPMEIAQAALRQGVAVVPGDVFFTDKRSCISALRLNFSHNSPSELHRAVDRLTKTIIQ